MWRIRTVLGAVFGGILGFLWGMAEGYKIIMIMFFAMLSALLCSMLGISIAWKLEKSRA
jgi:hypothetical protein